MKRCVKFLKNFFLERRRRKKGLIISSQTFTISFISLVGKKEIKEKKKLKKFF